MPQQQTRMDKLEVSSHTHMNTDTHLLSFWGSQLLLFVGIWLTACNCMQTLAEAFYGWQDSIAHQRELQVKLADCLQKWRTRDLIIAFQAFHDNAVKQRKAKAVGPCSRMFCFITVESSLLYASSIFNRSMQKS